MIKHSLTSTLVGRWCLSSLRSGTQQMFYKYLFIFIYSFIYEPLFGAGLPALFYSNIASSAGPWLWKLSVPEMSWLSCKASGLTLQSWIIDLKKALIFKDHRWPFSFMSSVFQARGDWRHETTQSESNTEEKDYCKGIIYAVFTPCRNYHNY